jgi:hypothetical protein
VAAGSALWFQWPRLDALERVTGEIEALRLPRVAGACYFRWPAPGEPLAPRQPYVSPSTGVSLQVTAERSGRSVLVRVVNRGTDAPLPSTGVRLEVKAGGAEVVSNSPVEYRSGEEPCSPLRADRALLTRALLRPGETWEACRVSAPASAVTVHAAWEDGAHLPRQASAHVEALASEPRPAPALISARRTSP